MGKFKNNIFMRGSPGCQAKFQWNFVDKKGIRC